MNTIGLFRPTCTSASHAWYELQQPQTGIYREFDYPKIVWPDIAKRCEFAIDESGAYIDMTLFTIPHKDYALLGLLNSSTVEWFVSQISSSIQQGFLRFKRAYVSQIPIPEMTGSERGELESIVRNLMDTSGTGSEVSAIQNALNEASYRIYNLDTGDIETIERFSKE